MKSVVSSIVILLGAFAHAGDIEWSGSYRVEGLKFDNPDMVSKRNKQYMLHHLVLRPKITAYDGITIQGRFDILNNDSYPNSAMGQYFGAGLNTANNPPSGTHNIDDSNSLSQSQKSDLIAINELYLTYAHDFGVLKVGRMPLHFGLGMFYNGGKGAFDHWFTNRDMVSYKFNLTGNFTLTPMFAKVAQNKPDIGDDVDDTMIQAQYENPETELVMGVLYRLRHGGTFGSDFPAGLVNATTSDFKRFKSEYWNLYFTRWIGDLKFGLEMGTQKGDTGLINNGANVTLDGYGIALEMDYLPKDSSLHYGLHAGAATGDDPSTPNVYEGYLFSRNYDVAFLLFNHPMGAYDIFRTSGVRSSTVPNSQQLDTETVSNTIYFAPYINHKWSEKWDGRLGLTYARLANNPLNVSVDKGVGFEVDATITYKPYNGIQWVNRIGVFAPGAAFKGGSNQYSTKTIYGLETKAAITF